MNPQEDVRVTHAVWIAVEQIVESMRAVTSHRCIPSWSTSHISARQQDQPGDAQRAPMSDLSLYAPRVVLVGWRSWPAREHWQRILTATTVDQLLAWSSPSAGVDMG